MNLQIKDEVYVKCRGCQDFTVVFVGKVYAVLEDIYGKQHWIPKVLCTPKEKEA